MIERFDLITLGCLSRNRFWGEDEQTARRPGRCTCTLVRGPGFRLLVDPSLPELEAMAEALDRRVGLTIDDIDTVFLTHGHGDHHYGLAHFQAARWLAPAAVAEALNARDAYDRALEPAEGALPAGLELLPTPGHTLDHTSLRFHCDGLDVVIAADAAMTRDFFQAREGYHNSADFGLVRDSIALIDRLADIIVPGHDNWFLNRRSG